MKKTATLFLLGITAIVGKSIGQPVITSSITSFPVGLVDSAYGASPTVLPGSGGAGIAWDMSTVPTIFAAKLTVVTPSSTPYTGTFPAATYCVKIEGTGTTYNYTRQSSTGVEDLALRYAGVGTGIDYSPNPLLSVPFPFSYLDTKSDTFQTTTSGPDTVRLTYDGYGTLKTPFHFYPSVIRIKEDYGSSYSYSWYSVSPFALVMNYSSSSNNYVIVTTPVVSTGVRNAQVASCAVVYPNPSSGNIILRTNLPEVYDHASIIITDISGKTVKQMPVSSAETTIQTNDLRPGMYFYTVQNGGMSAASGKFVIN